METLLRNLERNVSFGKLFIFTLVYFYFFSKKIREETDIMMAEENLRLREMELLTKQYEKENQLTEENNLSFRYENAIQQMNIQNIKLKDELEMVRFIIKMNSSEIL